MSGASVDGALFADYLRSVRQASSRIAFVITGGRGSGKSTSIKRFLSGCDAYKLSVGRMGVLHDPQVSVLYGDYFSVNDVNVALQNGSSIFPTSKCLVIDDVHLWIQLRRSNGKDDTLLQSWDGHLVLSCPLLECLLPILEATFIVVEYPIVPSLQYIVRSLRQAIPDHSLDTAIRLAQLAPKGLDASSLYDHIANAAVAVERFEECSSEKGKTRSTVFAEVLSNSLKTNGAAPILLPLLPPSLQFVHDRMKLLLGQHLAQFLDDDSSGAVSKLSSSTTGILLSGASGTGKSLLTYKLEEAYPSVPFIRVGSYEFFAKYLGESEEKLRQFFRAARKQSPCVVVLEDVDVIGQRRSEGAEGSSVTKRILTALLCELDGVEDSRGVFVLGTTSAVETLDGALLRQGRLETVLEVPSLTSEDVHILLQEKRPLITTSSFPFESLLERLVDRPISHFSREMRLLLESTLEESL